MAEKEKVLIVEDDPIIRANLSEILRLEGIESYQCVNGKEAMMLLKIRKVSLVITDWIMPEVDGMLLLQFIKSSPSFMHIPVIMITAKVQFDDKLSALEVGADDYLTKPFSIKELTLRIHNAIKNRKALISRVMLDEESEGLISKDEEFLIKLRQFILDNYKNEALSLKSFTEHFNMGTSNFQKRVKSITGKSAFDLLFEQRLIKAFDLIKSRAGNISDAAFQCGFKNTYYFTRKFKQYYGMTPSQLLYKNDKKSSISG